MPKHCMIPMVIASVAGAVSVLGIFARLVSYYGSTINFQDDDMQSIGEVDEGDH